MPDHEHLGDAVHAVDVAGDPDKAGTEHRPDDDPGEDVEQDVGGDAARSRVAVEEEPAEDEGDGDQQAVGEVGDSEELAGHVDAPRQVGNRHGRSLRKRLSRRLLLTTDTLENAMAAPAMTGLSRPAAASGRAATL